jgi:hypothetical protein
MQDSAAEYKNVIRERLEVVESQLAEVTKALEGLAIERALLESEASHLRALTELRSRSSDEPASVTLGSPEVKRTAGQRPGMPAGPDDVVALLREVGRPLHYTEIEPALRERGFATAGGQNPANTLLARYYNDPRLVRVSRGTYVARPEHADG